MSLRQSTVGRLAKALARRTYHDGWRSILPRDVARIALYALRDVSTVTGGGPIGDFERKFSLTTGARNALLMNSGTAALHSAYFAVGVGPGDEVIVPSYTFFASAAAMLPLGGVPIFCDIDPATLAADPDDIERRITSRTRAICVVHMWGNPARLDRIADIAGRHNLALIEDCSHAHGAFYKGRPVGTWGDVGCFSLQGSKPVSGGEAGVAVTSDSKLFDRMLVLGHFPRPLADQRATTFDTGEMSLGLKYRAHLYAALLAQSGLSRIDDLNERRRHNYEIISEELTACQSLETVSEYPDARRGGFYRFPVKLRTEHAPWWDRHSFIQAANAQGLPVAANPYPLVHLEPLFAKNLWADAEIFGRLHTSELATPSVLPTTERIWNEVMVLPPFTRVSERAVRGCARALCALAESRSSDRAIDVASSLN